MITESKMFRIDGFCGRRVAVEYGKGWLHISTTEPEGMELDEEGLNNLLEVLNRAKEAFQE